MSRLLPIVLAVVAVVALMVVEGGMTQRWGDSRHGAYCASLLDDVPAKIGDWVGEDLEVDDLVQVTAGARSYVSRSYLNEKTGERVGVWLIVGHSKNTARHTPDICYPSSGFEPESGYVQHVLPLGEGGEAEFFTDVYVRSGPAFGEQRERVYWTWFKAEPGSEKPVRWIAPKNRRMAIGACPSLYKLYFTCGGPSASAERDESVALRFAEEFLPVVNTLLSPANGSVPEGFTPSTT